ncbi:DNA-directed RNA polymerase [Bacillus velezensis]|uniref:DNA-directed RNA polymerase n=1 Tax=Bacillus velezensis TaxID=492670 RepID=UPI00207A20F7|nr:DNA-directed RNA polymerase [Bacillus velezensis]USK15907.1 DNA-directed RNA polymerase [Bacillus velezensis]USK19700.1 DNA-directed RNA polymerase [Bacillus velezensis]
MSGEVKILVQRLEDLNQGLRDEFNGYKDLKKTIVENDYVEMFSEISPMLKFAKNIFDFAQEIKFNMFLKGFNENDIPLDQQIQKLRKYIDNPIRAEFIANTINKILAANSSEACLIIGTILNSVVNENKDIEHEKLVVINALASFFNHDIQNYRKILGYINLKAEKTNKNRNIIMKEPKVIYHSDVWGQGNKQKIQAESMYLTLDKCVSFQIVNREYETRTDSSIDIDFESVDVETELDDFYVISSAGFTLYKYIKRLSEV